jgi:hypothetical protein
MVQSKRGKVILEDNGADSLLSLEHKIVLLEKLIRHIREKSLHRMNPKIFKEIFGAHQNAFDFSSR